MAFLPISQQDIRALGWDAPDFVLITGDSYVDHPSFGAAIIGRCLERGSYRVAVLSQPDTTTETDFTRFGRPTLGFLITSGNIDSMVAHYTAAKKKRSDDAYTAGNKAGKRPDRACIVYSRKVRDIFGADMPVILGGLEASLRRFAHYDYWDDKVMPSILMDAQADLIVYGMGENAILSIAEKLKAGQKADEITDVLGTVYSVPMERYAPIKAVECPSFEQVCANKKEYAKACRFQQDEQDEVIGRAIIQRHGSHMVVQNAPMPVLTTEEMDKVYALPFERAAHPVYEKQGGVPALLEVQYSITHNRGCFGGCNFCSLAFHQGRRIAVRSKPSLIMEAKAFTTDKNFKGYIHDVGGPTANFRAPSCEKQKTAGLCKGKKCLTANCKALQADHTEYVDILRDLRRIPGVKKVFIRSGIRYDYLQKDKDDTFLRELVEHHISGQLKVAPEHCSPNVLQKMGKPSIESYRQFSKRFYELTKSKGKKQYLVPYLMSSHPGCTLKDAIALAVFLKQNNIRPEQVQDFYPTPGTVSTCMFYTGLDPYTMEEVFVPKSAKDKSLQRALLQYFLPANRALLEEALRREKRMDLIGFGPDCLLKPDTQNSKPNASKPLRQKTNGRGQGTGKGKTKRR